MITQQYFDTYEGKEINVYQLSDKIDVLICPIGATVLSIRVPDRFGKNRRVAVDDGVRRNREKRRLYGVGSRTLRKQNFERKV